MERDAGIARSLRLHAARDPVWNALVELYVLQPGFAHHFPNLIPCEALLEPRSEPIQCVGSKGVEGAMTVIAQRKVRDIQADPLQQQRETAERPVNRCSDDGRQRLSKRER